MTRTLLIVEDEPDIVVLLEKFAQTKGLESITAMTLEAARKVIEARDVDLVIQNYFLPDGDGLSFFKEMRDRGVRIPFVFMTAYGQLERAVEVMREGAADFLVKPFSLPDFHRSIVSLMERPKGGASEGSPCILGTSAQLENARRQVEVFAPTDISILLMGESGTGKELFARAIHEGSKRRLGPFIDLDCATLPESLVETELFGHEKGSFTDATRRRRGRFEIAHGGTIFMDEIGNLSWPVQAKLLRILEAGSLRRIGGDEVIPCDVRVVAASNVDLLEGIRAGTFRPDLYYRLAELSIILPPLRHRTEDIPLLCQYFLKFYCTQMKKPVPVIPDEILTRLVNHSWPGNVRELRSVMRVAAIASEGRLSLSGELGRDGHPSQATPFEGVQERGGITIRIELPDESDGLDLKLLFKDLRGDLERRVLEHLLDRGRFSKASLARYLRLDYKTLLNKLKAHGLDVK